VLISCIQKYNTKLQHYTADIPRGPAKRYCVILELIIDHIFDVIGGLR